MFGENGKIPIINHWQGFFVLFVLKIAENFLYYLFFPLVGILDATYSDESDIAASE